jgi:hypothetical protein
MGGGQQQDPAMQSLQAQQQNKELAKALQSSMSGIGAAVAQPMPAYQAPQSRMQAGGYGGAVARPDVVTSLAPLFAPTSSSGIGGGAGIDESELARILAQLGYT